MKIESKLNLSVESMESVMAFNPEFADLSNPSGCIYGIIYYATYQNDYGEVFAFHPRMTEDEAISDLFFLLENADESDLEDQLVYHRIAYATKAYCDAEPEIVHREREDDLNPIF